jgi:glutamate--cysteine ligase
MIPHPSAPVIAPLRELERRVLESSSAIEHWLRLQWQDHTPPFYASVDLRNSGFKLAPVDTNLFPGGFNNLNPQFVPLAVQASMVAIERICPDARNLLLIPENHTRNPYYLQNVACLRTILRQAGLNVRIGTLIPDLATPTEVPMTGAPALVLEALVRQGGRLGLADFDPCTILLNNDLSAGVPEILKGLHDQCVTPPLHAGWAVRRKSNHFSRYERVANEFAQVLQIDPWLVNPYLARCGEVDFRTRAGEECLASNVAWLLEHIGAKYLEYGIEEEPYVVVKADAGTYGMGIMTAKSAASLRPLVHPARSLRQSGCDAEPVLLVRCGGSTRVARGRDRVGRNRAAGIDPDPQAQRR